MIFHITYKCRLGLNYPPTDRGWNSRKTLSWSSHSESPPLGLASHIF